MTEAEWLAADDPQPMLAFARGRAGDRKLRLYCCACCRRAWGRLGRGRRTALETAERYADGQAGWWGTLAGEFLALPDTHWERDPGRAERTAVYVAVRPWGRGPDGDGVAAAALVARMTDAGGDREPRAGSADLARDILGNPYRPVAFDPRWLTTDVLALARGIYDDRAFDRLPILADALMDAGCEDEQVLAHCRSEGRMCAGAGWWTWCSDGNRRRTRYAA